MSDHLLRLSGLEPFVLTADIPFVNVGERTNVTGSARFKKLITSGDFATALEVARDQVENGAQIIDINMDEGLIDSKAAMVEFLNLLAAEPDIARVPIMLDSSKWEVIEAGLQCVQGKAIVNSISLKEGEDEFRHHAALCLAYGAAVVVMAFDEQGQADTAERKIEICTRAYRIMFMPLGATLAMAWAASERASLAKPGEMVASFCPWRLMASSRRGLPCPRFTLTSCEAKSR